MHIMQIRICPPLAGSALQPFIMIITLDAVCLALAFTTFALVDAEIQLVI